MPSVERKSPLVFYFRDAIAARRAFALAARLCSNRSGEREAGPRIILEPGINL